VVTHQRLLDLVVVEQPAGVAGVFTGDHVGLAQDPQGAQGDILKVADRSGHQVDRPSHYHIVDV
jgi:hypothetical protein